MTNWKRKVDHSGRLATDVHIAALAMEFDATVASNDAEFSRFADLKVMNPLQAL